MSRSRRPPWFDCFGVLVRYESQIPQNKGDIYRAGGALCSCSLRRRGEALSTRLYAILVPGRMALVRPVPSSLDGNKTFTGTLLAAERDHTATAAVQYLSSCRRPGRNVERSHPLTISPPVASVRSQGVAWSFDGSHNL